MRCIEKKRRGIFATCLEKMAGKRQDLAPISAAPTSALTCFRDQAYDAQRVTNAFAELIHRAHNKYVFFVAENGKRAVVGALIGVIERQIFSNALTASVMHYDVLPEAHMGGYGVRLLKAFEQWAQNRKVIEINFGVNSVDDEAEQARLSRFAQRLGYRMVGSNFSKYGAI